MTDTEIRNHQAQVAEARAEFNRIWDAKIKLPIRDCCELAEVMWRHWPKERQAK